MTPRKQSIALSLLIVVTAFAAVAPQAAAETVEQGLAPPMSDPSTSGDGSVDAATGRFEVRVAATSPAGPASADRDDATAQASLTQVIDRTASKVEYEIVVRLLEASADASGDVASAAVDLEADHPALGSRRLGTIVSSDAAAPSTPQNLTFRLVWTREFIEPQELDVILRLAGAAQAECASLASQVCVDSSSASAHAVVELVHIRALVHVVNDYEFSAVIKCGAFVSREEPGFDGLIISNSGLKDDAYTLRTESVPAGIRIFILERRTEVDSRSNGGSSLRIETTLEEPDWMSYSIIVASRGDPDLVEVAFGSVKVVPEGSGSLCE